MSSDERLSASSDRHAIEQELDLGRRLFPRGFAGLLPDERARFLGLCAAVGGLAAIAAIIFRVALHATVIAFFGSRASGDLVDAAMGLPSWQRVALPALGGGLAAAIGSLAATRGGGVSGIMEAVSLKKGVVSLRQALIKSLCSLCNIASGGSIGREGPIIQLAAAVGSISGRRMLLTEERTRVLVACGAAAGFAAAYGTPMAATLFVVEVVAGTASAELLGPVAIAAVVATAVCEVVASTPIGPLMGASPVLEIVGNAVRPLVDSPLYGTKPFALVSPWEFVPYVILAMLSALVATIFLGLLDAAEWSYKRAFRSRLARAIAGGLAVGSIGLFSPYVYGNGYDTTLRIIDDPHTIAFLGMVLISKMVATSASVGSGGAGGVFTPTLLIGAALGSAVGNAAHYLAPGSTAEPGAYALVGMAALLAATTHAPLVAALFVFEGTRDYSIVLPLLLTGYVATTFAKTLRPQSIYEEEAGRRGVAIERNLEQRALRSIRAEVIMRAVPSFPPNLPLAAILETFSTSRATTLHVAGIDGRFAGVIDLAQVRDEVVEPGDALPRSGALARAVPSVTEDADGRAISEALLRGAREEVPVVDAGGRLRGVVTKRALAAAVDREVIRRGLRIQESLTDSGAIKSGLFALPPLQKLEQVRVPPSLVGKKIAQARIREGFGLNVVSVARKRADGTEERTVATAETMLGADEHLVVIGAADDIARFRATE